MANIALAFHWPLAALDAMSLEELADWERRAIAKLEALYGN